MACQNSNYKDVEYPFQRIEEKVTKIINDSVKEIDIDNLTPFKWSKMYIFKPYTSVDSIDDSLGFVWEGAEKTFINQEGDFHLLVFIENNEVINYIKWPINKGDFMRIKNLKYSYGSSKFILKKEKYGGQDKVFIYEKK